MTNKDYYTAGADFGALTEQEKINLLGGKGAGLQFMLANGINVPPFVTIPTTVYTEYAAAPAATMKEIASQLDDICGYFIDHFGYMPLVSVRSGARVSAPGMMDTVLNVGLDKTTLPFWEEKLGKACAGNCYHRLVHMYSDVVLGIPKGAVVAVPDARAQLLTCIEAVFQSWNTERCKIYRKLNNIPDDWGTAVTIQAMVFGNFNEQSCSGVLFTCNPDTGEDAIIGEFLPNAQGEDVVAGTSTPLKLEQMAAWNKEVYVELLGTVSKLEELKRDAQDVEFTVQDGKLYILQTRNAKRSAQAAVRIAVEMVKSKLITAQEAIGRISARDYDLSQQPVIDPKFKGAPLFTGIPACSGVVTGIVVHTAQAAIDCKEPCILVTQETTPDDIGGMIAAQGILTMTGGATSHAAVVARGMNKPCVVGLSQHLKYFPKGQQISIDGATGRVWKGVVPVLAASDSKALTAFKKMLWKHVGVQELNGADAVYVTTADTAMLPMLERVKAILSKVASAKGKVLIDCRYIVTDTEHSFFECFLPYEAGQIHNKTQDDFVEELCAVLKNNALESKVVLVGCWAKGLTSVPSINSLPELVMATGDVLMNISPLQHMIKQEVLDKLVALKGTEISPMSVGVAAKGAKSYISEMQLIATMLNSK